MTSNFVPVFHVNLLPEFFLKLSIGLGMNILDKIQKRVSIQFYI